MMIKKMASAARSQPLRIAPINRHTVTQLTNMANELKRMLTAAKSAHESQLRADRSRTRPTDKDEANDRGPLATRFLEDFEAKMSAAHMAVEDALLTAQIFQVVEGTEVAPIPVDEW
jgi:hypothetical protein